MNKTLKKIIGFFSIVMAFSGAQTAYGMKYINKRTVKIVGGAVAVSALITLAKEPINSGLSWAINHPGYATLFGLVATPGVVWYAKALNTSADTVTDTVIEKTPIIARTSKNTAIKATNVSVAAGKAVTYTVPQALWEGSKYTLKSIANLCVAPIAGAKWTLNQLRQNYNKARAAQT